MTIIRVLAVVLLAFTLPGCAAAALAIGSVAFGTGVDHTLGGIVYRTFASSVSHTRKAVLKTLRRMDMPVSKDVATEEGWEITATATERTIEIELEVLSRRTTRMRVVANDGDFFLKDSATAEEIAAQTARSFE